ncbi:hypothetical protein GPALN_014685 [Globodera pallida]|uniref:Charged multivesicular body protein 7 n=1 Tax=Globodera pallida TaxID=36090 RepID=A0A183BYM1_GLOPA|nr:hypothetical protein GPALN_014685 [Globodera pallida]
MASSNKPPYLPDNWDNDVEMSGLMSFLKARHVNPTNYDRVIEYWKKVISDYCRNQNKCIFSLDELKLKFKRGSQLPSPLSTVVAEMQSSGLVQSKEEVEKQSQGWLKWSFSLLKPNWLQGLSSPSDASSNHRFELVHIPTLKNQATDLLRFYRNHYELFADCSDVVDYNELREQTMHLIDQQCFDLVINELARMGEVSVGSSKSGDRVLKFKDQTSKGPARFTETDANVHNLNQTMRRLDTEIKKAEQKEQMLKEEARAALERKDKKGALNTMRKVARVRKDIQDKDVQYQRLLAMLEQLASSKQTKEIIEVYQQGSNAFRETMARQGLTSDKVDITMDSVMETMQDYQDVEEALREGFKHLPSAASESLDDAELESELNALIREGEEEEQRVAERAWPKVPVPVAVEDNNRIRVGKRVLDLGDLPEVPKGGPAQIFAAASSSSTPVLAENGGTSSLEERWKRLRMHAAS